MKISIPVFRNNHRGVFLEYHNSGKKQWSFGRLVMMGEGISPFQRGNLMSPEESRQTIPSLPPLTPLLLLGILNNSNKRVFDRLIE
mmetsp:Transcript_26464/g.37575  ORF Transcript_26464/g.37575 Transcript_26464/m.37575 type:complete len:86 (-) Transcript_26464:269-526(-)